MTRFLWTYDLVKAESVKYRNRTDFNVGAKSAYLWAWRHKKLDELFPDTPRSHRKSKRWTYDMVNEVSLKYDSRWEFQTNEHSAYTWAKRNKCIAEICDHMPIPVFWTYDTVKEEAMKYQTRIDFRLGSPSAEKWAWQNDVHPEMCAHMGRGVSGYRNYEAGILYLSDHTLAIKIGITNTRVKKRRQEVDVSLRNLGHTLDSSNVFAIRFFNGKTAPLLEKYVLEEYSEHLKPIEYCDGRTEMLCPSIKEDIENDILSFLEILDINNTTYVIL